MQNLEIYNMRKFYEKKIYKNLAKKKIIRLISCDDENHNNDVIKGLVLF